MAIHRLKFLRNPLAIVLHCPYDGKLVVCSPPSDCNGSKILVHGNVTSLNGIDLCKLLHKILGVNVGITYIILFGFIVDMVGFSSVWQGNLCVWIHGITQTPVEYAIFDWLTWVVLLHPYPSSEWIKGFVSGKVVGWIAHLVIVLVHCFEELSKISIFVMLPPISSIVVLLSTNIILQRKVNRFSDIVAVNKS